MKVYNYQEMLKFKEKCCRKNDMMFGHFDVYGCSIPILFHSDTSNYNLCLIYNYTNIFTKGYYKDLNIFKQIFKNNQEYFQKFLGEKINETI